MTRPNATLPGDGAPIGVNDGAGPLGAEGQGARRFRYRKPDGQATPKAIVSLGRTDILRGAVQVVVSGGENNLHVHTGMDLFYMVLRGKVRFYRNEDEAIGVFGPQEGLLIPRNTPYWFESADSEPLELLQIGAFDRSVQNRRVDLSPRPRDIEKVEQYNAEVKDEEPALAGWHRVGAVADLAQNQPISARIGGREIGIFLVDGRIHAMEDTCPHAFALLSQGFVEGDTVECPLHGAIFHIPTGKCLKEPADRDLKTYPVRVEDGSILVDLGG